MNRHVNAIAGRLSLRAPQRRSLEILDRITEIVPPTKARTRRRRSRTIRSEFPTVTDFERDFPSLCFALATGVGKTRLMGAFISYLHLAHGIDNFFVLAPNLTIYNKLIADFTPNTPKYVFKGIAEFATDPPEIITGDNYEAARSDARSIRWSAARSTSSTSRRSTPRSAAASRRGSSGCPSTSARATSSTSPNLHDLVLLMDESHRYRASAGVRAINELKPILGLELTATPFVETRAAPVAVQERRSTTIRLAKAMEDGFVKEPAVVTRKNFDPAGMPAEELERMKLEDGVRLHESVKVELETYARETERPDRQAVRARHRARHDARGAAARAHPVRRLLRGPLRDKVIQVDSSSTGAEEEEMIERLLKVEHTDEPTEIVIHVNMLKEGWDVTNLYTIVPLRAANARILIEQSIGRGLRLPYGKRTGVAAVDRLNIVAHDRFQEIVDEANRPDSPIRMATIVLDVAGSERTERRRPLALRSRWAAAPRRSPVRSVGRRSRCSPSGGAERAGSRARLSNDSRRTRPRCPRRGI